MKSASVYKKDYEWSERVIVRFEDLKSSPQKKLKKICSKWGITWSDSLLMTIRNGKKNFFIMECLKYQILICNLFIILMKHIFLSWID